MCSLLYVCVQNLCCSWLSLLCFIFKWHCSEIFLGGMSCLCGVRPRNGRGVTLVIERKAKPCVALFGFTFDYHSKSYEWNPLKPKRCEKQVRQHDVFHTVWALTAVITTSAPARCWDYGRKMGQGGDKCVARCSPPSPIFPFPS